MHVLNLCAINYFILFWIFDYMYYCELHICNLFGNEFWSCTNLVDFHPPYEPLLPLWKFNKCIRYFFVNTVLMQTLMHTPCNTCTDILPMWARRDCADMMLTPRIWVMGYHWSCKICKFVVALIDENKMAQMRWNANAN